ncbi:MAG: hypothetical protein QXQ40_01480 [Candidatus Aenigmatarchaeota archaeon]
MLSYSELSQEGSIDIDQSYKGLESPEFLVVRFRNPRKKDKYEGLELLIEYAPTLGEMGRYYGKTRERMRQVLKEKGLHEKWKRERTKRAEKRREMMRRLAETIYLVALKRSDIAFQKASEYYYKFSRTISLSSLIDFFERYYSAKGAGKRMSLKMLSEPFEISISTASRILKKVKEEPLYYKNKKAERKRIRNDELEIINRALNIDTRLSFSDISKILENVYGIRCNRMTLNRRAKFRRKRCFKKFGYPEGDISYAKAMDLLDALDAGLQKEEAMEYAGIKTEKAYNFILSHKDEIKEEIKKFISAIGS